MERYTTNQILKILKRKVDARPLGKLRYFLKLNSSDFFFGDSTY